ncbi:uncharacterized protein YbjT (DUF2867 family) [Leifsonia sp. AK011]|uniref:SDR family oxidoreductase n=1 Tax=Leifsonia sp. AK011 TaxID=2723075 RepID=UPI0015CE88FF|nr:NAD(P)H-binding protein [Leifsonia sp. AK011]NYF10947.1 uncharacterized protein YbjT (DUF2867 family) [Leifsonia sp. AK011]
MTILVTGGTGTLGRPTVDLLRAAGHDVRILSRTSGDGRVVGDVTTGAGLADALRGVDTVLHLATSTGSKDPLQTRNVVEAAKAAGVAHLVYISIVGVDVVPYSYYRAKFESERIIEESGIPFTILRASQFHQFLRLFIDLQRKLPMIIVIDAPDQPIAVEEVAARLAELVEAGPSGRVPDIAGPEQLELKDAIATWQRHAGTRKPVWTMPLFGKTIRAFREGRHMTGLPGYGRETFETYAAREARGTNEA